MKLFNGVCLVTDWYNFKIDGNGNLYFFSQTPDYENPQDNNSDNIYKFNVIAKDNAGNKSITANSHNY